MAHRENINISLYKLKGNSGNERESHVEPLPPPRKTLRPETD
ncbi:protein of unknown function (plasmid) [Methylocella tundrae]|uniref:Uncharacterized protein n=1 Tax=Methylocella tundrae TaxID=227605 RepID=A0A4U8Z7D5_METTU|nr:protein of unknown function [Methylocella tundrae]